MKAGDLVEFKAGLFGLQPPENIAVYLGRHKEKHTWWVEMFTLKGRQRVLPDRLTARRFSAHIDPADGEERMRQRIRELLPALAAGRRDVGGPPAARGKGADRAPSQGGGGPAPLTDEALWIALGEDAGPLSAEEIARRFFQVESLRRDQSGAVASALAPCATVGVGYFQRVGGHGGDWQPLPRATVKAIRQHVEAIHALRNRLLRVEPGVGDDGRPREILRGVLPAAAGLTPEQMALLQGFLVPAIEGIVEDDGAGRLGLAGTPVHTLGSISLLRTCTALGFDWTGAGPGRPAAGVLLEFLLDAGLADERRTLEVIARRHLRASSAPQGPPTGSAAHEADRLPAEVSPDLATAAPRVDLRARTCHTIDPPTAADFDDAVGMEPGPSGGTTLWVHIADVSAYVRRGTSLDAHARERGTSIYLPTGVEPMLPPALSERLCSLRAGEDRLAMSIAIEVDAAGRTNGVRAVESVIRVARNCAYGEVDDAIVAGGEPFAGLRRLADRMDAHRRGLPIETAELRIQLHAEGIDPQVKLPTPATKMIETFMVAANEAVARLLEEGGLAFPSRCHPLPDRSAVEQFNAQCAVLGIDADIVLPADRPMPGERDGGVPGASLVALLQQGGRIALGVGATTGGALAAPAKPGRERAPAGPDGRVVDGEEQAEGAREDAEAAGSAGATSASGALRPVVAGIAQVPEPEREDWMGPFRVALAGVESLADPRLREVATLKLLGCLGRAFYTPRNIGHFGLGSAKYCHFTSPIRRYPDLVTHRQLRWLLRRTAGDPDVGEAPPHDPAEVESICAECTETERRAERLERDVVRAGLVLASRGWSGGSGGRGGVVAGFGRGGVGVLLGEGFEGWIPLPTIAGGPYTIDEHGAVLLPAASTGEWIRRGMAKGKDATRLAAQLAAADGGDAGPPPRLRLGQRVEVLLAERDLARGRIVLRLHEAGASVGLAGGGPITGGAGRSRSS